MNNAIPTVPPPANEPVRSYAPGSPERASLQRKLREMRDADVEIPAFIGGKEIRTGRTEAVVMPHRHGHRLGTAHLCGSEEVGLAVESAMAAWREWSNWHWTERAAVFLRAAALLAGPWRDILNAATMLGQSKNAYQAEIDSACELIDFFRFNAHFMERIYADQPNSPEGTWNRMQYRPLEGFVFAVAPFNFTSIAGNLPTSPALMGNVVLWKPASSAVLSAYYIYRLLEEAGLPPGVLNMLPGHGAEVGDPVLADRRLAGLH
ncbi:MAG TPA: aldehyde dehydrogenase family protein, partial [Rhodothermales bacterium]